MSARAKRICAAARDLRDRLKAEDRHRDAQIIQDLVLSAECSGRLNETQHAENMSLRRMMAWYRNGQPGARPE